MAIILQCISHEIKEESDWNIICWVPDANKKLMARQKSLGAIDHMTHDMLEAHVQSVLKKMVEKFLVERPLDD